MTESQPTTSAYRMARKRKHDSGDHSICRPEWCDAARAARAGTDVALAVEEDLALAPTGRPMVSTREAAARLLAATLDAMTPAERTRHAAAIVGQIRGLALDLEDAAAEDDDE